MGTNVSPCPRGLRPRQRAGAHVRAAAAAAVADVFGWAPGGAMAVAPGSRRRMNARPGHGHHRGKCGGRHAQARAEVVVTVVCCEGCEGDEGRRCGIVVFAVGFESRRRITIPYCTRVYDPVHALYAEQVSKVPTWP